MSKSIEEYWRERAIRYERDWIKRSKDTVEKRLARHYQKALSEIKDDLLQLYGFMATVNGLDFNEARKTLSRRDFITWQTATLEYIRENRSGLTQDLFTLAARNQINRLERVYADTIQELDRMGRKVNDDMRNFLASAFKGNYSRDIYDLVKTGKLLVDVSKAEVPSIEKVLAARWSGKNYSQRIWTNTRLLSRAVRDVISTGFHRGSSVEQLAKRLDDKMHAGYSNALRLVQTEMNFVNNQAHADAMIAAGVEYYEFVAVLDKRTSARCRSRNGEVYLLEEKSVGSNFPPLHPRCRSTVAPFIDDGNRKIGKNTPRNALNLSQNALNTGSNIQIPEAMKYREYEAIYVEKKQTIDQWKAKNGGNSTTTLTNSPQNATINKNLKNSTNYNTFEELRDYWKLKYNVRLNKPLSKLDFQAVCEATEGIEEVITEFPKAGKFLRKMKVMDFNDGTYMASSFHGDIIFDKIAFNDFIYFVNLITNNVMSGYSLKNAKIRSIGAHEMGHFLERALIEKYGGDINDWIKGTYAKKICKEAVENIRKTPEGKISYRDIAGKLRKRNITIKELQLEISEYASSAWSETLAEAVSDVITNKENASRLSKEIWQILKRELI